MNHFRGDLVVISCDSGKEFAEKILKEINKRSKKKIHLLDSEEITFANTEIKSVLNESVRGKDVFVIQDVENHYNGKSVDENLRALYSVLGACKRCDANYVTAVIPSFPYSRQDKQWGREDISAARVAWELEGSMGADHIITIDLHNTAIQGFFRISWVDNLKGSQVLLPYIKRLIKNPENTTILPTDLGGAKRANYYSTYLNTDVAFAYKVRNYKKKNTVSDLKIMGNVKNRTVYIVDDMIDTGGTFCKTVEIAKSNGAKEIIGVTTFGLLNGNAIETLNTLYNDGKFSKLICTDATYITKDVLQQNKWIKVLSVSSYFAEVIFRLNKRESIGELLG
jgi:ribose-phosphate pyrophosphokinase